MVLDLNVILLKLFFNLNNTLKQIMTDTFILMILRHKGIKWCSRAIWQELGKDLSSSMRLHWAYCRESYDFFQLQERIQPRLNKWEWIYSLRPLRGRDSFSSVQFSHSVMSNSLWPHELQHTRPPCPSPTPGVYSNSCPSSWWCDPAVSSSVVPFFSCPQSLPASGSFPLSQLLAWGGQVLGFSFSISPSNEHPGLISFRMDWLDLLAVRGTLKSLLQHHSSKASILRCSAFFTVQLSHPYMTIGKTVALTRWAFVGKVMSLLFSMLSMLVITFLPRSKCSLKHSFALGLKWYNQFSCSLHFLFPPPLGGSILG